MEIKSLLKHKVNLSEKDIKSVDQIEQRIKTLFNSDDDFQKFTLPILKLLHDGHDVNPINFIESVFLDFNIIRAKTELHKSRIYDQLEKVMDECKDLDLVKMYRDIISDLFDPYINLMAASLQFIKGKFVSIQQTNLSQSEFNKYEFVISKIPNNDLLNGYNSIVRNAISHAGSEGIIYEEDAVIFRNIKRVTSPEINYVKWTYYDLKERIHDLMNFIHGVDCAVEIFGFDSSNIILTTESLSTKFIDEIMTKQQRQKFHDNVESSLIKITQNPSFSLKQKLDVLTSLFFIECRKRDLEITSVAFQDNSKTTLLEVPCLNTDISIENEVLSRTMVLLRYGIISVTFYKFKYEYCQIQESALDHRNQLTVVVKFKDLDDYGKENLGMYDLLYDCSLYINKVFTPIEVDFDELERLDYTSTGRRFPKKKRKST